MYTYRIVLSAYNTRAADAKPATVLTYSRGYDRADALRKLRTIYIARDGSVSDGINVWPGSNNLPAGPVQARHLPEYAVESIRTVRKPGTPRILAE